MFQSHQGHPIQSSAWLYCPAFYCSTSDANTAGASQINDIALSRLVVQSDQRNTRVSWSSIARRPRNLGTLNRILAASHSEISKQKSSAIRSRFLTIPAKSTFMYHPPKAEELPSSVSHTHTQTSRAYTYSATSAEALLLLASAPGGFDR